MVVGKKRVLFNYWECNLVQKLHESEWRFPKNLKVEIPYGPMVCHSCVYNPKDQNQQILHMSSYSCLWWPRHGIRIGACQQMSRSRHTHNVLLVICKEE